jgi:hypothetical protein
VKKGETIGLTAHTAHLHVFDESGRAYPHIDAK